MRSAYQLQIVDVNKLGKQTKVTLKVLVINFRKIYAFFLNQQIQMTLISGFFWYIISKTKLCQKISIPSTEGFFFCSKPPHPSGNSNLAFYYHYKNLGFWRTPPPPPEFPANLPWVEYGYFSVTAFSYSAFRHYNIIIVVKPGDKTQC